MIISFLGRFIFIQFIPALIFGRFRVAFFPNVVPNFSVSKICTLDVFCDALKSVTGKAVFFRRTLKGFAATVFMSS